MTRMKDKQFVVICNWFHEIVLGAPGKQEVPQEVGKGCTMKTRLYMQREN